MVRLEGFMDIQQLHHDGVSVSEIARQLNMDRKTVRKYLRQAPRKYERKPKCWKIDPFRVYLRERWELGVVNASRLFVEIQKRGYLPCTLHSLQAVAIKFELLCGVAGYVTFSRSSCMDRGFLRFRTSHN
jgi:hypothetical protein